MCGRGYLYHSPSCKRDQWVHHRERGRWVGGWVGGWVGDRKIEEKQAVLNEVLDARGGWVGGRGDRSSSLPLSKH